MKVFNTIKNVIDANPSTTIKVCLGVAGGCLFAFGYVAGNRKAWTDMTKVISAYEADILEMAEQFRKDEDEDDFIEPDCDDDWTDYMGDENSVVLPSHIRRSPEGETGLGDPSDVADQLKSAKDAIAGDVLGTTSDYEDEDVDDIVETDEGEDADDIEEGEDADVNPMIQICPDVPLFGGKTEGYSEKVCTYFKEDDIVGGFDEDLEVIEGNEAVSQAVEFFLDHPDEYGEIWVADHAEHVVYEMIISGAFYQEAYDEIHRNA